MALCPEETNLLAKAGREMALSLLPAPFALRFSDHDTGRQMTITADGMDVWVGSVWHHSRYNFNDDKKIGGIQPDFEFAAPVIERFFADVRASVAERERVAAERSAAYAEKSEAERLARIAALRDAVAAAKLAT